MSLTTPLSVQKLQTALHDKAKGSPKFRFYAVYDKVYREDVMAFAYECCKANRGAGQLKPLNALPNVTSFLWPQSRKAFGLRVVQSAVHLNAVHNVVRQQPRRRARNGGQLFWS
jgi:hypothetical protein